MTSIWDSTKVTVTATYRIPVDTGASGAPSHYLTSELLTYFQTNTDADDIDDTSTTNKFTTAGDISKLADIEDLADVTDEANVVAALDGATLTGATVATGDKILLQDADDADNLKTATAQSIAALRVIEVSEDTTPQLGGDLDCQQNVIQDFEIFRAEVTSTTPTASAAETGQVIEYNNVSAITVALPNTLPVGWTITAIQTGAGQVTFAGAATLQHRQAHDSIAGQWGMATLVCIANSGGSAAVVVLAGDTA